MSEERLLVDLIEDYTAESILQSAQHRLYVIENNIINIKKSIETLKRQNKGSKQRIKIVLNRLKFIDDDIRSFQNLKYNIEAKIAEFIIEFQESPDTLPVVYDPQLELFIDQKVEYYSNHVICHRVLTEKKRRIVAYVHKLQNTLEELKKELISHQETVAKCNDWIPQLRSKHEEISAEINAFENGFAALVEGNIDISPHMNGLAKGRFDHMHDILEEKMRTLMNLEGFSQHIQNERDNHVNAIPGVIEKIDRVRKEISNYMNLLEETYIQLQTVEMKYKKVEEQIRTYINIQEGTNFVDKCRAYYDLIATYGQERENALGILNSVQEKYLNQMIQFATLESSLSSLLNEKIHAEITITTLLANAD